MEGNTIVNLDNVSIYQNQFLVLKDVNLTIKKGEFVYLIGKTGTGKSSLLKTLYGELPVKNGVANIVGFDLVNIKKKQIPYLRRNLGIVFQDFQLLTDKTIHENLLFVLKATGWKNKNKMNDRILWALDKVNISNKNYKMPHQLSGGEQQRVVIARALLNDPDIILADEPTGNLDPETSEGIMNLLFSIADSGKSVLMATHDYSLFKNYPSRTLICQDSKVRQLV